MSACDYNLTHKSGEKNSNADCLSQFYAENKKEQSLLKNAVFITDLMNAPVTCKNVREETHKNLILTRAVKYLQ